jgi:hypothetical protein
MIGSPSAVIGIGPLISCRIPSSFNSGIRCAAASASGAKRSKSGGNSSGPKVAAMPPAPHERVLGSQPPTASAPGSGFT